MILIVGLGNPGKKYETTRHNIGFMAIENLKAALRGGTFGSRKIENFSDWKYEKKFDALTGQGRIDKQDVILIKPQAFMNESGKSVRAIYIKYKIRDTRYIFIIHDDVDLPLGKIRIVKNRGAGGHKGIESIIRELKTKNFIRIRIGIQPKTGKPKNVENFVIKKFAKGEEEIIKKVIKKTTEAVEFCLEEGVEKAMSEYNG